MRRAFALSDAPVTSARKRLSICLAMEVVAAGCWLTSNGKPPTPPSATDSASSSALSSVRGTTYLFKSRTPRGRFTSISRSTCWSVFPLHMVPPAISAPSLDLRGNSRSEHDVFMNRVSAHLPPVAIVRAQVCTSDSYILCVKYSLPVQDMRTGNSSLRCCRYGRTLRSNIPIAPSEVNIELNR